MTYDEKINTEKAEEAGAKILGAMVGNTVLDHSFKKINQVDARQSAKIEGESLHVDPQFLFQRLVMAASGNPDGMQDLFKYELSGHLSAMFEPSGLLRQAPKSVLADAIWTAAKCTEMPMPTVEW